MQSEATNEYITFFFSFLLNTTATINKNCKQQCNKIFAFFLSHSSISTTIKKMKHNTQKIAKIKSKLNDWLINFFYINSNFNQS